MNFLVEAWNALRSGGLVSKSLNRVRWELDFRAYRLPEVEVIGSLNLQDIIFDDICLPPFYGHHRHDDVTPLFTLVQTMEPKLVVELGTAHGNLTANLCRLTSARVVTVNALAEQMTGEWVTFALNRDEIGRVYRRMGFGDRVVQIYENTLGLKLGEYVGRETVDVGIVDACHDSAYVLSDFQMLAPMIRPGGLVLLHDTHPDINRASGGGYRACMALRKFGWDVMHIKGTWWGFWVRGGQAGSKVSHLLRLQPMSRS